VFEFLRDDALDARPYSFTATQAAAPKAPFKWNQYGYTAAPDLEEPSVLHVEFRGLQGSEAIPDSL